MTNKRRTKIGYSKCDSSLNDVNNDTNLNKLISLINALVKPIIGETITNRESISEDRTNGNTRLSDLLFVFFNYHN